MNERKLVLYFSNRVCSALRIKGRFFIAIAQMASLSQSRKNILPLSHTNFLHLCRIVYFHNMQVVLDRVRKVTLVLRMCRSGFPRKSQFGGI